MRLIDVRLERRPIGVRQLSRSAPTTPATTRHVHLRFITRLCPFCTLQAAHSSQLRHTNPPTHSPPALRSVPSHHSPPHSPEWACSQSFARRGSRRGRSGYSCCTRVQPTISVSAADVISFPQRAGQRRQDDARQADPRRGRQPSLSNTGVQHQDNHSQGIQPQRL